MASRSSAWLMATGRSSGRPRITRRKRAEPGRPILTALLPKDRISATEASWRFTQSSKAEVSVRSSVSWAISKRVCAGELTAPPVGKYTISGVGRLVRRIRAPLRRGHFSACVDSSILPRGIRRKPQYSAAVFPEAHESGTAQHAAAISAVMSRVDLPSANTVPRWIGRMTPSRISRRRVDGPIPIRSRSSMRITPLRSSAAAMSSPSFLVMVNHVGRRSAATEIAHPEALRTRIGSLRFRVGDC